MAKKKPPKNGSSGPNELHSLNNKFKYSGPRGATIPVPGGPTTMVRPGFMPLRMASTCTGVKRTLFFLGTS